MAYDIRQLCARRNNNAVSRYSPGSHHGGPSAGRVDLRSGPMATSKASFQTVSQSLRRSLCVVCGQREADG